MSAGYYQNGDSASLSKVSKLDDTASQLIKNIQDFWETKVKYESWRDFSKDIQTQAKQELVKQRL